jgi:hypothetical protein
MSENINFFQGQTNILKGVDNSDRSTIDDKLTRIKEKINEFFNMKNIHFLLGSGASCDAIPNMRGLYNAVKEKIDALPEKDVELKAEFYSVQKRLKSGDNLEEMLGALYSHKSYLEDFQKTNFEEVNEEIREIIGHDSWSQCISLITLIENEIYTKIHVNFSDNENFKEDSEVLKVLKRYEKFYRKVALRNKDLSRVNVFTTNNDLFNEVALDNLNIHYINGFGSGLNKFFNPALFNYTFSKRMDTSIEKFEPVENMVYLYKLHGSVNWLEDNQNSNTFFNIKEVIDPSFDPKGKNVLVYPTPTKQNKSLGSPYADMFREFQKKLLEPHSVLFVIGYGFNDEHVNNIIYQALATNSTINVVAFNSLENSKISEVDDNRIFRIWGTYNDEKIHYFDYLSNNLIPDIDSFKTQDNNIDKFVDFFKNNLSSK